MCTVINKNVFTNTMERKYTSKPITSQYYISEEITNLKQEINAILAKSSSGNLPQAQKKKNLHFFWICHIWATKDPFLIVYWVDTHSGRHYKGSANNSSKILHKITKVLNRYEPGGEVHGNWVSSSVQTMMNLFQIYEANLDIWCKILFIAH